MNKTSLLLLAFVGVFLISVPIDATWAQSSMDSGATVNMGAPDDTPLKLNSTSSDNENVGAFIINWILRGASFTSPESTLFGALSMVLNAVCLAFVVTVLGKHGLQYATLTATQGVPGGQKLPGGVIAIRSALAISLLTPIIGNGFSPIQVVVKETAEFGAYVADTAIIKTTDYLTGESGEGTATITPPILGGLREVVWGVFVNETCVHAVNRYHQSDIQRTGEEFSNFTYSASTSSIQYRWNYSPNPDKITTQKPSCGTLTMKLPSQLNGKIESKNGSFTISSNGDQSDNHYKIKVEKTHKAVLALREEIKSIISDLFNDELYASQIIAAKRSKKLSIEDYESAFDAIMGQSKEIDGKLLSYANRIIIADNNYRNSIKSIGSEIAKEIMNNEDTMVTTSNGERWDHVLERQGFAALGAYYWIQMKLNLQVMTAQSHLLSDTPWEAPEIFNISEGTEDILKQIVEQEWFKTYSSRLVNVENYYLSGRTIDKTSFDFSAIDDASDMDEGSGWFKRIINGIPVALSELMHDTLVKSTHNDIIINMMNLGVIIVSLCEWGLFAFILGSIVFKFLPAGKAASMAGKVAGFPMLEKIASAAIPVLIVGLIIGVTMQYILPAIPLVKWLVSLQSWAIMMFIAMVYAPIWMLTTASATSDDWINDKTYDGFVVIAELILRPILMVFGFFAAMMLMVVADLGARMAWPYLLGLGKEGTFGIIGIIVVFAISVFLVYKLVMRTFDLIVELPDYAISRLGGSPMGGAARDEESPTILAGANIAESKTQQVIGQMAGGSVSGGIGGAKSGKALGKASMPAKDIVT